MSQNETIVLTASVSEIFSPLIKGAANKFRFQLQDSAHAYVLSICERYLFADVLFSGQSREPMLAESLLRALQEESVSQKQQQLQFLGESILFKSGFFADSLKRKIVGVEYYLDMGRTAYENLYFSSKNPLHIDFSKRFPGYVDLFSEVGNQVNLTGKEDLVVLFDRYLGGSQVAESKLIELGVTPLRTKKASGQ